MATGVEKWTQVEFRSYVQNVIKQWRNGELYTSMGVSEKDIVIGHGQGPPDPKSKSHPFNKMLECAASDIVQKLDIKARKATKTILKQIQEHRQVWAEMILTGGSGSGNNEDDDSTSHLADPSTPSKVKQEETDEVNEEVLDDGFQEEHQEDTMVQDVVAKQEDDSENDVLDDDAEIGLEDDESSSAAEKIEAKREAKRERFEKERDDILADVPKQVKDRFGKIFFSKWSINILPVLVLSPYSVPPGPVRNMWFDMYHKVKAQGRLPKMTHLCYWYGAYNDPHNAYSFIATSKLIDYDQGVKKGHNTVSKVTQKNIDAGKNISSQLEQLVRGLGEMNEDLELEPSERTGRMNDIFTEEWELSDDSEDDQQQEEPEPKASKSRKKPKEEEKKQNPIKKRKKKDIGKDEPEKKLKKKVKKEEETKDGKKVKKKTKDDPAVSKKKAELVDDIGDDDISSHDDKDDEDIDEPETESDDGDDYLDHGKSKPKPEITKKIKVKEDKKPPKKRAVKAKTKIEKKPAKEKKAPTQKKLKEMEQDRFEDCEKMFLPLINSWKNAIEEKDADALNDCYVELLKSVDNFTCPFIEAYEISPLLKQSKLISKNPTFKELFKACKEVYIKKRSDTPIGFQPIKTPVTEDPTTLKDDSAMQEDGKPEAVENSNDKKSNDTTQEPKVEVASIPLKKVGSLEKVNSTMRRIGSLENVDEQEVQLQQNSTAVKVERKKKFSLSGLMRPSSNPTKAISKLNTGKATASGQLSRQQKIPEWMSESNTETPSDETRSFALEFLQQAAPFIPHIKHVNHDAIARALEVATYEWAFLKEGANWVRTYWEKVDDLVASISGKHGVGTLASLIAEGKFNSPDEIIRLSDDAILCSFEGRPLPGM